MSVYPSGNVYPPIAIPPHTHPRSDITDLFSSPFWNNIPDKPSAFTPSAHASSHLKGGADEVLNLSNINAAVGFSIDAHASRHKQGGADEVVGVVLQGTTLPTAGVAGRFFLKTDVLEFYYDNGTSWVKVGKLAGLDLDAHASRHDIGGADQIPGLASHKSRHLKGGADEVLNLTNINSAVGFSIEAHRARHEKGGVDEVRALGSITADDIALATRTTDPTLAAGRIWFRSDVKELRSSLDGTSITTFAPAKDAFARQLALTSAPVIHPWILPESIESTHLSGSLKALITWSAPERITSDVVIPSGCSYGRPRLLIVDSGGRLKVDGAFAVY
jgi:hypothetical protein